jgi:pimeloyl-ACP methyl ester carboxylesterase
MLQRKPLVPQRQQSVEERRALAARCLHSIEEMNFDDDDDDDDDDNNNDVSGSNSQITLLPLERKLLLKKASISGWFLGAPISEIRRGNLEQWVCWAFFLKRRRDIQKKITNDENENEGSNEMNEVNYLVDQIIQWAKIDPLKIQDGFNPSVKCIRLDFDPIPSTYRPFIYYLVTYGLVGLTTEVIMKHWFGFVKHSSGCLTYWYRKGTQKNYTSKNVNTTCVNNNNLSSTCSGSTCTNNQTSLQPIVFCHGLGVGVLSYVTLVNELLSNAASNADLFMVELPHIAMRPIESQASPRELSTCIEDLLHVHNHTSAHFVGHSFGTLVLTWIAKHTPHLASRYTFLDPVCFLLCKHDVAYNFLYKTPTNGAEALMSYFVGQELFISYTLSRRFYWQANILWPEEIMNVPTTVVLSQNDHIVPSKAVKRHLTSWKVSQDAEACGSGCELKVVWLEGIGHAGFLLNRKAQTTVVKIIAGEYL